MADARLGQMEMADVAAENPALSGYGGVAAMLDMDAATISGDLALEEGRIPGHADTLIDAYAASRRSVPALSRDASMRFSASSRSLAVAEAGSDHEQAVLPLTILSRRSRPNPGRTWSTHPARANLAAEGGFDVAGALPKARRDAGLRHPATAKSASSTAPDVIEALRGIDAITRASPIGEVVERTDPGTDPPQLRLILPPAENGDDRVGVDCFQAIGRYWRRSGSWTIASATSRPGWKSSGGA